MRVLFVLPEYPPDHGGGIITFYRDLVPALRANGCAVRILKGSAFVRGFPDYIHEGVEVSVLADKWYDEWHRRFERFAMFPELRSHLAAAFALHEQASHLGEFDAVEVTDWGLLFLPWVLSGDKRVTVQLHGSCGQIAYRDPVAGREAQGILVLLMEQVALRCAPKLCTHSRSNARWWNQVLNRELDLVPPAFRPPIPTEERSRSGWLAFGRVQHWKGPEVLCRAWARLGTDAPLIEWHGRDLIHGASGNSTSEWLQTQYPGVWGISIRLLAQLTPSAVRLKMEASEVVVIPSLWDVYNLVTVEAMAAGCVVLVSDGAGAVDLIEHGVNGFVFAANDDEALAKLAMEVLRLTPEQRSQLGVAAQATVLESLCPSRIARDKMALYQKVVLDKFEQSDWLASSLAVPPQTSDASFLDALPLRKLVTYVAKRGFEKLVSAIRK
jgi:glycosyltransferase involved in cell wall biosynthesis